MMKHLGTSLAVSAGAALAAAFAVLWMPTLAGKVITGAALAYWAAHSLRRHKLARKGTDAVLAGTLAAVALLIWLPAAVPLAVFVILALPGVAHHTNPKRKTVARTTRGARTPAAKAAGGRAGRPGETLPARKRTAASAPRSPARTPKPAPAARTPQKPSQRPAWPHASGDARPSTFLPFAGEDSPGWGTGSAAPKRLRKDDYRPGPVARALCGDCAAGDCNRCAGRGCECPRTGHPARKPAVYVPPELPDEPPF